MKGKIPKLLEMLTEEKNNIKLINLQFKVKVCLLFLTFYLLFLMQP